MFEKASRTARASVEIDRQSSTVIDHATLAHTNAAINETSVDNEANLLNEPTTPGSSEVRVLP